MTSSALFEAIDLSIAAGGVSLLSGIHITLNCGDSLALTGPSGCGKSTLLRALCGLDDPTSGAVRLAGRTPDQWGLPAFRRQVVYLEQKPVLLDETVEETLRRPFAYRSATSSFPTDRALLLLDRLGIGSARRDQPARTLSVGQQQRLCLIRALLLQPKVLLLDEPTSALDADSIASVETVLTEELTERGLAMIVVTHDLAQAERWCRVRQDLRPHMVQKSVAP